MCPFDFSLLANKRTRYSARHLLSHFQISLKLLIIVSFYKQVWGKWVKCTNVFFLSTFQICCLAAVCALVHFLSKCCFQIFIGSPKWFWVVASGELFFQTKLTCICSPFPVRGGMANCSHPQKMERIWEAVSLV